MQVIYPSTSGVKYQFPKVQSWEWFYWSYFYLPALNRKHTICRLHIILPHYKEVGSRYYQIHCSPSYCFSAYKSTLVCCHWCRRAVHKKQYETSWQQIKCDQLHIEEIIWHWTHKHSRYWSHTREASEVTRSGICQIPKIESPFNAIIAKSKATFHELVQLKKEVVNESSLAAFYFWPTLRQAGLH